MEDAKQPEVYTISIKGPRFSISLNAEDAEDLAVIEVAMNQVRKHVATKIAEGEARRER